LLSASCNESRRGNDNNLNEDRNEAAAESNKDKFAGKKQRDATFVYEVVETNYSEIKLAELGNQKSRNPEIKRMAEMLQTDHTSSLNELKTIAQAKAISVPVQEADASRRRVEKLSEESNSDFDKAWLDEMISIHDQSIDRFEKRLDDTEDPELKAFVEKTLPVLKKHREELNAIHEKNKKSA
jgi:putative membrane protein